jgi:hypothetical protein
MRVLVNSVRLFFDVEGAKLVPNCGVMREQPTLLLKGEPDVATIRALPRVHHPGPVRRPCASREWFPTIHADLAEGGHMSDQRNYGDETTTDELLDGVDLSGRRVLVTGASSGLGAETARALAARGADVRR